LELDRSTLCYSVGQAVWLLDPIVTAIRAHVVTAERIHGGDTTVPVPGPNKARRHHGSRMLRLTLAADSLTSGNTINPRRLRRRWIASAPSKPSKRAAFAPIAERVEPRHEAAPLINAFFKWAEARVAKFSAKSSLACALSYAINRCEALSRLVTDGRLEMDNNTAKKAMRCIALGRKNYLFAGSHIGGERAPSNYTIVQTAKFNGGDLEAYLRYTLTKVADGHPITRVDELMPWPRIVKVKHDGTSILLVPRYRP